MLTGGGRRAVLLGLRGAGSAPWRAEHVVLGSRPCVVKADPLRLLGGQLDGPIQRHAARAGLPRRRGARALADDQRRRRRRLQLTRDRPAVRGKHVGFPVVEVKSCRGPECERLDPGTVTLCRVRGHDDDPVPGSRDPDVSKHRAQTISQDRDRALNRRAKRGVWIHWRGAKDDPDSGAGRRTRPRARVHPESHRDHEHDRQHRDPQSDGRGRRPRNPRRMPPATTRSLGARARLAEPLKLRPKLPEKPQIAHRESSSDRYDSSAPANERKPRDTRALTACSDTPSKLAASA